MEGDLAHLEAGLLAKVADGRVDDLADGKLAAFDAVGFDQLAAVIEDGFRDGVHGPAGLEAKVDVRTG